MDFNLRKPKQKDTKGAKPPEQQSRIYYLDWLRIGAVFLVFVMHASQFFSAVLDWKI